MDQWDTSIHILHSFSLKFPFSPDSLCLLLFKAHVHTNKIHTHPHLKRSIFRQKRKSLEHKETNSVKLVREVHLHICAMQSIYSFIVSIFALTVCVCVKNRFLYILKDCKFSFIIMHYKNALVCLHVDVFFPSFLVNIILWELTGFNSFSFWTFGKKNNLVKCIWKVHIIKYCLYLENFRLILNAKQVHINTISSSPSFVWVFSFNSFNSMFRHVEGCSILVPPI